MSVFGYILPRSRQLIKIAKLNQVAKYRLAIVQFYLRNDQRGRLTARTFNISTATVYRWVNRYRKWNLKTLNNRSHRPHHLRQPIVEWELMQKIVEIRKTNPTWSKYKIYPQLVREGFKTSVSTVGRTLKRKGLIVKSVKVKKRSKTCILNRPKANRELWAASPGSLVQIDTAYLNPKGRGFCFQYIAVDCVTRLAWGKVYPTRGAKNGQLFLKEVKQFFPFKIQAIQSDNGSEFLGNFHENLEKEHISHYFTYPATPKMNSRVERLIRTTREELWNQGYLLGDLDDLNQSLTEYLTKYNHQRPHQSLNYQAPMEYYLNLTKTGASRFR